jgi:hypothetical protein
MYPSSSLPDAETADNNPPSQIAMPKNASPSRSYGEPFFATLISVHAVSIETPNGERYKACLKQDNKPVVAWSSHPITEPIGSECAVEPVTVDGKVYYNMF